MKSKRKNLWLYEAKRVLILPAAIPVIYLLYAVSLTIIFSSNERAVYLPSFDETTKNFLYVFLCVLGVSLIYRSIADKKLYDKVRISQEKIFWIRLSLIFVSCFLFVLLAVCVGTVSALNLRQQDPDGYALCRYSLLFSFLDKPWYYFLFGISVGMFAAVGYSLYTIAWSAWTSSMHWVFKAVWCLLPLALIVVAAKLPRCTVDSPTLANGIFGVSLPIGEWSYDCYRQFSNRYPQFFAVVPALLHCKTSWNILNVVILFYGLGVIALGFFSVFFFNRQNEAYLYVKEDLQHEK